MAYMNVVRGVESGLIEHLSTYVNTLRENRQRQRLYRQTVRELSALTDRELADLGLHRSAIENIAHEAAYGK